MSFWEGLTEAMDDIRHTVVEEPFFGRQVTGDIALPEQEPAAQESSKWQDITQDIGTIQPPEPPAPEMGMEQ